MSPESNKIRMEYRRPKRRNPALSLVLLLVLLAIGMTAWWFTTMSR